MKAALRRTITLGVAVTTAAALAPAVASAAPAEKRVTMKNGVIKADGAAVKLPTSFTCPAGFEAFLSAQIIQALGSKFAGGFDTAVRQCTGERQKITFYIQAVPAENTRPFREGPASARVILDAIDPESQGPFFEEAPAETFEEPAEPGLLPPLPVGTQRIRGDEPVPGEPAEAVHAEDRSTIQLRER